MTDDEQIDELLAAYGSGDPWFTIDQMVDNNPVGLRDLAWAMLRRIRTLEQNQRERVGLPDGRLH